MASFGERVVGVLTLNVGTFEEIEADTTAIGQAVGVVVLAAVSTGIGNVFRDGQMGLIAGMITSLVGYALWAALVFLIGTKLMPEAATKADFPEVFRVVGFCAAPGILGFIAIIPFLGPIISLVLGIWSLVAMVIGVRQALDYSTTAKAVVVCLIGFVGYMVVMFLLMAPLMAMLAFSR